MKWNRSTRSCTRSPSNVRALRLDAGLTLNDLAAAAGLGKSTLAQLESGKANPSVETLWAIAAALKVPFARLVEEERTALRVVRARDVPPMHSAETPGWAGRLLDRLTRPRDVRPLLARPRRGRRPARRRRITPGSSSTSSWSSAASSRAGDGHGRARGRRPRHVRRRRPARLRGARDDALRAAHGVPVIAAATSSGCSSCTAWPAPSTTTTWQSGIAPAIRSGDRAELRVALADHQRDRHRELAEPIPQRRHHAGAEPAQRGGETVRRVAQPVGVRRGGDALGLPGEQRLAPPLGRERLDADRLDAGRRAPRRRAGAPRARPASAMPGLAPTSTSRSTCCGSVSAV